ncbi:MAG: radical SAM family heme chaperone HemW [Candidatus Dormibacteria bacterium]
MTVEPNARSIYLHIPFCDTRCPYCDFAIHIGGAGLRHPYVEAVITELAYLAASGRPPASLDTVYLGGGTPGLLEPALLERLLSAVAQRFGISPGAEITIEANPTRLTEKLARNWRSLGINRLSLGVQSLDDKALDWLGRNHDSAAAVAALEAAAKVGFENLSCDLIYNIPAQPTVVFAAGLQRLLTYSPAHVSCYELTVEPATPLARSIARGDLAAPREGRFRAQHRLARELLESGGLYQYEVSNYALPGRESRHNLVYWERRHYLAAGCGAHGFVSRTAAHGLGLGIEAHHLDARYWNLRSASTYIKQVAALGHGRRGYEAIDGKQSELERVACGLRLRSGLELAGAEQIQEAGRLARLGLLTISGRRVAATLRGIEVLDRVTLELAGTLAGRS